MTDQRRDQTPSNQPSAGKLAPRQVLRGGGEMGELMRSIDWSKTEVGGVEHWPQSMRTAVSILLESRFPMYIAWGAGFTQFYNDGFRPILGSTKHPAAMGGSSRETFAEIWDVIGPMFDGVMQGNAVGFEDLLMPLDRHGFLEECYFLFSYSPIRDESGDVGGVLVTVTETTLRVLSERRLRTLRDLAGRAADAKSVAQACKSAMDVLAENSADIPFAMLYLREEDGDHVSLAGTAGIAGDTAAAPLKVDLAAAADTQWPLAAVARSGQPAMVEDVAQRLGSLPGGKWPETPRVAILLPIARPGQERPYGVLIAGVSPRLALDDAYRGFFGLVADHCATGIANARAYQEERLRAEKLAEIDRAKTTFFSNVSHEFRTPLTLMLGPTEDALARPDAALSGEALQIVHRNALRLLKLVNALLEFSRIEAGRAQAVYEPTDLAQLTEELASGFRSAIERAGLRLTVEVAALSEPAYVDHEMWEKIILNLLSNAFKFTFDGGIMVALREVARGFELDVRDTGAGIPAHELGNVFKRFHRVEGIPARTHEGSGIGLALVHELVRLHGGEIRVASEPGQGSTFTVFIPRGSAHLPADRLGAKRTLPSTASGVEAYVEEALRWLPGRPSRGEGEVARWSRDTRPVNDAEPARILLADDNADMRSYTGRLLAERWTVEAVADGASALAAARRDPPDLVLSDIMMPGLDGHALLRELRADPRTRDIPVILLSARAGEESRVEGLAAGAEDYLAKPFSARELIARVSTHLELSRLRRQSREEYRKLYSLFMQAPAPIAVIRDEELVFEMANALYIEVVGGRDIVGKPMLEAMPELAGQGYDDLLREVMRTGKAHVGREMRVDLDRKGTGAYETAYFTFIYAPMKNPDGSCERVMAFCSDVTEQVVARHKVEEADRRKDEFLAMLAHELRNPLAPIRTALQVLRMRDGAFDRPHEIIDRQTANLARLVDDLLDVSRLTRGRIELRSELVDLTVVVPRAVDSVRQLVEQRRHELTVALSPKPLVIAGDPVRLEQIFVNLLGNAAKYTDLGGQIRVAVERVGAAAEVTIADTGNGIDVDMLPKIFNLFEQAERTLDRAQGGLGIGLTIVRTLVELHGGTVEARSPGLGRGSTFVVRLPLAAAPGATEAEAEAGAEDGDRTPAAQAPGARRALRVLVVDDNVDAADTLAELFRALGHEVRTCHDGRSALGVVAGYRPHLMLLDIGLPEMDGYEVARQLRQEGLDPGMLVALTGYGQEGDRQRALDAGFAQHLVKPVSFATLRQLLDGLGTAADR